MHQAVLVHPYIHNGTKGGSVGYNSLEFHARHDILDLFIPPARLAIFSRFVVNLRSSLAD